MPAFILPTLVLHCRHEQDGVLWSLMSSHESFESLEDYLYANQKSFTVHKIWKMLTHTAIHDFDKMFYLQSRNRQLRVLKYAHLPGSFRISDETLAQELAQYTICLGFLTETVGQLDPAVQLSLYTEAVQRLQDEIDTKPSATLTEEILYRGDITLYTGKIAALGCQEN